MFVLLVLSDDVAGDQVEPDMKSVLGDLAVFKLLHLIRLLQPAFQDPTHALHCTLCQLVCTTLVVVYPPTAHIHPHNRLTAICETTWVSQYQKKHSPTHNHEEEEERFAQTTRSASSQ